MFFQQVNLYFLFAIFYLTYASEVLNTCKNNGSLISLDSDLGCYCGGLRYFGRFCEKPCILLQFFGYQIPLQTFPEKCLENDCDEISFECVDVRIALIAVRPKIKIEKCEKKSLIKKKCYDDDTYTLYTNRTLKQTPEEPCQHNGKKLKIDFNQSCQCMGTHFYGSHCQYNCDKLGFYIPEICLNKNNTNCPLPRSCVDLSRKNIHINRCKNNTPLQVGRNGNLCHCHASGYYGDHCDIPCPFEKKLKNMPIECIF